jgi:hypothetical protein
VTHILTTHHNSPSRLDMMSSIHMAPFPAYAPTSDVISRHEYGVNKPRKQASTGGGRAWSEEEELYLLQTRHQKMPYKHIAAHLKKTELACRLHFHQLSHGSNRRKRNASISSGSSFNQSPVMTASAPSPTPEMGSRSMSPNGHGAPGSPLRPMQLPSLMDHHSSNSGLHHHQNTMVHPPRLPAILPRPTSMGALPPPHAESPLGGYPTPVPDSRSTFSSLPRIQTASAALQIDCAVRNGPAPALGPAFRHELSQPQHQQALPPHQHIDMARLGAIYNAHRASFWGALATEYGPGVSPVDLEQAWKSGACCSSTSTPITPVSSPDNNIYEPAHERAAGGPASFTPPMSLHPPVRGHDKTRIAAILGIDASPRSPSERELVRRLEKERGL